jgi:Thiolase, N-terminal domain/Acyl-CoA dehydrogenase, C-terminal domain
LIVDWPAAVMEPLLLLVSPDTFKVRTDAVPAGYGYSRDHRVERYMREAKITPIFKGTSQSQRLVISRLIAKRPPRFRKVMPVSTSVIVAGARTPIGRLQGSLSSFSGADLGSVAIEAALGRAGVAATEIQYVIMAGNASTINDGACAVVMMSKERAEFEGLAWLAEIGEHGMVAGPDSGLQFQPSRAITTAKATLVDQLKDRIRSLATDFPALWYNPDTPKRDHKRMVGLLGG